MGIMKAIHQRLNPEWERHAKAWSTEYWNKGCHRYLTTEYEFLQANIPKNVEQYITTQGELVHVDYDNYIGVLLGNDGQFHRHPLQEFTVIQDLGQLSDGYHTFNELYEYRLLYNAAFFNELAKLGMYDVHKSKLHSDGEIPFGDSNWFIVMAELPTGQISNHYEMKDWDLFKVPEKEKANPWDGHSPKDVAQRLREFLK